MTTSRELAAARAGGQCEAMVRVGSIYARCGVRPVDCHHRLKRGNGGKLLDQELEIYHLICLCRQHHEWAHKKVQMATDVGLFLEGSAYRDGIRIVYEGPDTYLTGKYGKDESYEIQRLGTEW